MERKQKKGVERASSGEGWRKEKEVADYNEKGRGRGGRE